MGNQLAELFLRHAVVQRAPEMALELLRPIRRDEHRAGNQAAVALRKFGTLPDVAEQHFFRRLDQLGNGSADAVASFARGCLGHFVLSRVWIAGEEPIASGQARHPLGQIGLASAMSSGCTVTTLPPCHWMIASCASIRRPTGSKRRW